MYDLCHGFRIKCGMAILLLLTTAYFLLPTVSHIHAQYEEDWLTDPFAPTISPGNPSQEYLLEIEQIIATPEAKLSPERPSALSTAEQNILTTDGYIIPSLTDNWYDDRITFSLSRNYIPFQHMNEATQQKQASDLAVSTSFGSGFQLLTQQMTSFHTAAGHEISPTSCDTIASPCHPQRAGRWERGDRFGLGYNLSGSNVPSDFMGTEYFRPLGTEEIVLLAEPVLQKKHSTTMTFKVQTPDNQPQGNYVTIVKMLALPVP